MTNVFSSSNWDEIKLKELKLKQLKDTKLNTDWMIFINKASVILLKNEAVQTDTLFSNLLTNGTFTDRLTALVLSIKKSPILNTNHLDQLFNISKKKSTREKELAITSLKEVFIGVGDNPGIIPNNRKLLFFHEQPIVIQFVKNLAMKVKNIPKPSKIGSSGEMGYSYQNIISFFQENQFDNISLNTLYQHLIVYAFENHLKNLFYNYLLVLSQSYQVDNVPVTPFSSLPVPIQISRLHTLSEILHSKKEQENTVLAMIVNKFGASDRKVAATASQLLKSFISKYPSSLYIVIREVERMIRRNAIIKQTVKLSQKVDGKQKSDSKSSVMSLDARKKSQYSGFVFLSEIIYGQRPMDVVCARYLVNFYFSSFEQIMKKDSEESDVDNTKLIKDSTKNSKKNPKSKIDEKSELISADAKIISALLTGLHRAFPFAFSSENFEKSALGVYINDSSVVKYSSASEFDSCVTPHLLNLFRTVHSKMVPFTTSVSALQVLYQFVMNARSSVEDEKLKNRYYRALYGLLLDPRIQLSSKSHAILLNVIYKSLSNLMEPTLQTSNSDPMIDFTKIKTDSQMKANAQTSLAIMKRLIQVCVSMIGGEMDSASSNGFICAALIVISSVLKKYSDPLTEKTNAPVVRKKNRRNKSKKDDETLLQKTDVKCSKIWKWIARSLVSSENDLLQTLISELNQKSDSINLSDDEEEHFVDIDDEDQDRKPSAVSVASKSDHQSKEIDSSKLYDPLHRSPEYCNAINSAFWELTILASHYHPTVSLFARTLLSFTNLSDLKNIQTCSIQDFEQLKPGVITYPSNPLEDFHLTNFLNTFVYKSPKSISHEATEEHKDQNKLCPRPLYNSVLREPVKMDRTKLAPISVRLTNRNKQNDVLNAEDAIKHGKMVPVDEQFYDVFFRHKNELNQSKPETPVSKESENWSDVDEDGEPLSESEIYDAIMKTVPGGKEIFDSNDDSDIEEDFDDYSDSDDVDDSKAVGGNDDDNESDIEDDLKEFESNGEDNESDIEDDLKAFDSNGEESDTVDVDSMDGDFDMVSEESMSDETDEDLEDVFQLESDEEEKKSLKKQKPKKKRSNMKLDLSAAVENAEKQKRKNESNELSKDSENVKEKKKRKLSTNVFASSENYEHLLNEPDFNDPFWNDKEDGDESGEDN